MINALKYSLLGAIWLSGAAGAQEQRWFEVELIIFSQTPASAINETFGDTVKPIKPGRSYDLLTPLYQPELDSLLAALPLCPLQQTPAAVFQPMPLLKQTMCIFEPQPAPWQHTNLFQPANIITTVAYPPKLPATITGRGQHVNRPYLAAQDALQLKDIANKVSRLPGNTLLLHTSWRQVPVTERRAIASRWYGGKNLSQQFDYWGQPNPATNTDVAAVVDSNLSLSALNTAPLTVDAAAGNAGNNVMQLIDELLHQLNANSQLVTAPDDALSAITPQQLSSTALPSQVWQLDGLFKLHLDHYLFVNTEFNLRVPGTDKLDTVYVRQSRRLISGEVHYLDHPHLGIVLQIRRFEPPIAPEPLPPEPAELTN